jgi:hypothetical protein
MRRALLFLVFVGVAWSWAPANALARREQAFAYPYTRVWEAAVRLLRVDLESPIGEKNRDDGYFLFEFPNNGKTTPGSVEVVRADEGKVLVVVQLPALPSYVEQMVLDKLARKLTAEYGQPPAPPAPSPAKPEVKPDAPKTKPPAGKPAAKPSQPAK